MSVFGFTLLRNGIKYDYPFLESLRSLCALCEEVVVALGDSDDGTGERLKEFKNLVILPTTWDEQMRKSGLILSQQTNLALEALRSRHARGWGFYLQADEVISEADYPRIHADLKSAESSGCDAVSFRYLHFWQSYHRVAVDRRWYPQEIRAIRLDSSARSYGDAQSFEGGKKRFESDALIYHYGHVREAEAYERKKSDFGRWWHGDEELKKVLAKGARRDKHERTLAYYGRQPIYMKEKIGPTFSPPAKEMILVYGDATKFPGLGSSIEGELEWTLSLRRLLAQSPQKTVMLAPLPCWAFFLRFLGYRSQVPPAMRSPQARPWAPEFIAALKFFERGVYSK